MRQWAVFRRQDSRRCIIPHRGQRFLAILGHWRKDLLKLFDGVACRDLALAKFRTAEHRCLGDSGKSLVQLVDLADPFAKWLGCRQTVLDLGIVEQLSFFHVHGNQLTRPKRTFFAHGRFLDRHHSSLGPSNQQAIARHDIAHRAQAVPVKTRADPATVGHRKCGRTVPRFHHRVAIGIHVAPAFRQFNRLLGPRLGHQHGFRHRRRAASAHQHLEHGVECGRIRGP